MNSVILVTIAVIGSCFISQVQAQQSAVLPNLEQITEIMLEHKGCCGPCPIEKVIFRPDGDHTYIGVANVERLGTYRPRSRGYVFEVLIRVLERLDFFRLQSNYARSIGPQETIITVTRGAETRAVIAVFNWMRPDTRND